MELQEPMDVDAGAEYDKFDETLEEGEYIESNRVSRKSIPDTILIPQSKIENKAGSFITGVDIFSKEAKEKLEERAKRFGISKDKEKFSLQDIENLYDSFGIVEGSENAKNYRLNVLHMRGIERMSTKDIFEYFANYPPASIEEVDDISCNIVWLDKATAARAVLGLSKRIVGTRKPDQKYSDDESDEDLIIVNGGRNHKEEKNTIHVRDIRCQVPTGIWRKGQDYFDSRSIFLRFATHADKKLPFNEKIHLKGILRTSRKRPHRQAKEMITPKIEPGTNGSANKNPWGFLSENWGVTDFVEDDYLPKVPPPPPEPVSNIRERLGFRAPKRRHVDEPDYEIEFSEEEELPEEEESESEESSTDDENWCKRSKIPRMRMHADDEEQKIEKRKGKIRTLVGQSVPIGSNDLRKRLTARRRLPRKLSPVGYPLQLSPKYKEDIQVIVTNPKAIRSNFHNLNVTEDEDEDETEHGIDEEEEGEIIESESDSKVESIADDDGDDDEDGVEAGSESVSHSESDADTSDSSSISGKEIQGPKGSVIKVVPRQKPTKPKLASAVVSTVTRVDHSRQDKYKSIDRSRNDLRNTLGKRKSDVRSRIGNHHMRGRSPLRIELRNDKYSARRSDSD